jgi:hypothetical protein
MSNLNQAKREQYKKILKVEITDATNQVLDEIIDFLFDLASIEASIIEQHNYEDKDCNFNGTGLK